MKLHSLVPGQYCPVQAIKLVIEDSIRESNLVNCLGTFFPLTTQVYVLCLIFMNW